MEAGKALILSQRQKVQPQHHVDYDYTLSLTNQKGNRKLKRDCLYEKKKMKNQQREESKVDNLNTTNIGTKCKSDEDHSVTTQESDLKKSKIASINIVHKDLFCLDKLILKPAYLTIAQTNRFVGDIGHATAIFKRPIIQGSFYVEFTVKEQIRKDKKILNKSAVRIGIVNCTYNPSFPIGSGESLGYKSVDGGFVTDSNKFQQKQSYGVGDVIGVSMKINSPKKIPNPNQINQGSSISFFKNGKLIFQYTNLKQIFYCFAVSLYNFSQVQVNLSSESKYAMPQQSKPYFTVLNENIPYKNLKQQRMFKI